MGNGTNQGQLRRKLFAWNDRLLDYYGLALFLVLWQAAPSLGLVDRAFVPPPSTILSAALGLARGGDLLQHVGASLARVLVGFIVAVVTAVPLGFVLAGGAPPVARFLRPLFMLFSQVNAFSLFPIFILFFGIGESAKLAVIFWSSLWPVLFMTLAGVRGVDRALLKTARSMNAPRATVFLKVTLPASAPAVFTGIRMGGSIAFLMLIAAEMVGASQGLGWLIHNSQVNNIIPRVFAAALIIALLGVCLNFLLRCLEAHVVSWKPESLGGIHELPAL